MKYSIKHLSSQQGQALLFVVVAMTIAMAIGINASVRTISSISRTTRTDTSSRALAAAEGGIERFLALSAQQLEDAIEGNCPIGSSDSDTNTCVLILESSQDNLVSEAYVTVSRYTPESYTFELSNGGLKEINLHDFISDEFYDEDDIQICWTTPDDSAITYLSYSNQGIESHGGLIKALNANYDGFDLAVASRPGYDACSTVSIGTEITGLRVRSIGGQSAVGVFATGSATLPLQGYEIVSVGRLQQDGGVTATRTIKAIRTLPYLPGSFDYALYSQGPID